MQILLTERREDLNDPYGRNVRKVFASNINKELKAKGISKSDLADQSGIADSTIDRVLNGLALSSGIIAKVSQVLRVDYWVLFVEEEE